MSKTICVDYGHGGNTGARNGNIIEDNLINVTADECVRVLKHAGFKVLQTRTTNTLVSFDSRTNLSNNNKADFFISIHYNSGGGEGFECIRTLRDSVTTVGVANNILKRLQSICQVKRSRPIYTREGTGGKDYFAVLRGTKCPALILEGAFIDNAKDIQRINSSDKLKAFGRIYAEAIIEYFGGTIDKPKPEQPVEKLPIRDIDEIYHTEGVVTIDINSALSIRNYPTTDSELADTVLNGTRLNLIYPADKDWWAISYDRNKSRGVAFVQKKYLKTK